MRRTETAAHPVSHRALAGPYEMPVATRRPTLSVSTGERTALRPLWYQPSNLRMDWLMTDGADPPLALE